MRPMPIVLFHIRVRTLNVLLLPHPFFFAMGWTFFYLPKLLRSINPLPRTSLLWTFYLQDPCYRSTWTYVLFETEEFLLCSSSVSALSHLQAVVPIFDLAAKVLSPSSTADLLPLYNTAHHLIRDVNSCKEPFSYLYPSSSMERNICASLKIQIQMCPFETSAIRFKWGHSKLCIHHPNCF